MSGLFRYFNPLSPHGERREGTGSLNPTWVISIHSPRMGRDLYPAVDVMQALHFNPLSPHGERLGTDLEEYNVEIFQSTLPAWGETLWNVCISKG